MNVPELDFDACRARQQRLLEQMERQRLGLVVLTRAESIQWLTGARVGPLFTPIAAINAEGQVVLVLPSRKVETPAAADKVVAYEEKWLSTMRDLCDQQASSIAVLFDNLPSAGGEAACEQADAPLMLTSAWHGTWRDVDPLMFRLRRRKDADELAMMAYANRANQAMYEHARQAIEPGLDEISLYNQLHAVAVETLGEPLTYLGQDFRANARGGAPRARAAEAGELWILDLGVGLRGYHTDNARTIAVNGQPTDEQQQAWEMLSGVFPHIERSVKPGVSCKQVFDQVVELLKPAEPWLFNHHLGHGVGLAPHEWPHLNPNWDDTFEPGDYFTVEPGLYHDELRHGIRLEQNYVVTETGVQLVTDWPLDL